MNAPTCWPRPALAVLVLAALSALAPTAAGAGFGQPVIVSGSDHADFAQVAVAPNGRTAVLYERTIPTGRASRREFRAAIGPSPERLGAPVTVKAGWRSAASYSRAQLFARPDGGFVACFPDQTPRRATVDGCSIAPPNGQFGPRIEARRLARGRNPGLQAAMRPDGSVILLLTSYSSRANGQVRSSRTVTRSLSSEGVLGPERLVERAASEQEFASIPTLAVAADGTVALPATVPVNRAQGKRRPGVRLMAPGADTFGPAVPVASEEMSYSLTVTGGAELLVSYSVPVPDGAEYGDYELHVVRRASDGTFGPPLALPGNNNVSAALLPLPTGTLAITSEIQTADGDADCFNPISGSVGYGMLGAPGVTPRPVALSAPGQIPQYPQVASLTDGTTIAAWEDAANYPGRSRVEVALRSPGATAFNRPRVLPRLTEFQGVNLSAGGTQAALAWTTGREDVRTSIVVSALRTAEPYAKFTPRPTKPEAPCDE